jgi:hypothetical protein
MLEHVKIGSEARSHPHGMAMFPGMAERMGNISQGVSPFIKGFQWDTAMFHSFIDDDWMRIQIYSL